MIDSKTVCNFYVCTFSQLRTIYLFMYIFIYFEHVLFKLILCLYYVLLSICL